MSEAYYIITFESVDDALQAEVLLSAQSSSIIPLPTEIDADCGFAVRLPEASLSGMPEHIVFTGLYRITGRGASKSVQFIKGGV